MHKNTRSPRNSERHRNTGDQKNQQNLLEPQKITKTVRSRRENERALGIQKSPHSKTDTGNPQRKIKITVATPNQRQGVAKKPRQSNPKRVRSSESHPSEAEWSDNPQHPQIIPAHTSVKNAGIIQLQSPRLEKQ